jgi:hypothetical protein
MTALTEVVDFDLLGLKQAVDEGEHADMDHKQEED